jgi:hypothetical protein
MIILQGPSPVTSSASFSCAGLTFSNFIGIDAGGVPNPNVSLVAAETTNTGNVNLLFNPGLTAGQDLHLFFTVTGGLNGIDLSVGGTTTSAVTERACGAPLITSTTDTNRLCPSGTGLISTPGSSINATAGQTVATALTGTSQQTWIFKDITTGSSDVDLTSLTQSFHPIPEPMSFVLMGSGLLGLGLARRRRRA